MANNYYGAIAVTGGTNGALDKIDGAILADGDLATVIDASANAAYHYTLDSGSGAAEAAPGVISPDTNPGTKRWILTKIVALGADFDGYEVVLDADGDTSITSDTDDQIDFKTNGTDRMSLTNSGLQLASGARLNEFSTDGTMAGNSDVAAPTEQAVVEYCDSLVGTGGSGVVAYKNKIINGNFDIWQRTTSAAAADAAIADRWLARIGGSGAEAATVSRQTFVLGQTDVPGNPTYYMRSVFTTGAANDEYHGFGQRIEGVSTFSGETVTLSFYAKASAGTPNIAIEYEQNFGSGGSATVNAIGVEKFAISASWTKYTITTAISSIAGKTVGAGNFLGINIWLSMGSDYNARCDTLGTQSITFDIAQVQIETGSVATAFDYRHVAQELALCQRYYEKSYDQAVAPGTASTVGVVFHREPSTMGAAYLKYISFSVTKRTTPTTINVHSSNSGTVNLVYNASLTADKAAAATLAGPTGFITQATAAGTTNADNQNLYWQWTADAEL